jgi:hypothetical protein
LGDIETTILFCCETTSEKKKKGLFDFLLSGDPDPIHYTGIILTPGWLVWSRSGPKSGVATSAARISEIEISNLLARFKNGQDSSPQALNGEGLSIFGFINQSPEKVTAFIGLGAEPAAQKLRDLLAETIAQKQAH